MPLGERWRIRPEDVVDLDGDAFPELLIDATCLGGPCRVGALRAVSTQRPQAPDWVLLMPHRDEPGAFAWRLEEPQKGQPARVAFGPVGGSGSPLWISHRVAYEPVLTHEPKNRERGTSERLTPFPVWLIPEGEDRDTETHAEALAQDLYPWLDP